MRDELSRHEEEATVPAGTKLISQTVVPGHLILVQHGSVEISVSGAARVTRLSVAGKGKVLGLRAILSGERPEIEATALDDCRIFRIPRQAFLEVACRRPEIYFAICKVLSADLDIAERFLRETPRTPPRKRKVVG